MHTDFKGERHSRCYELLGSDQDSVAILHGSSLPDGQSIQHIHFVGARHFWIALGRQREWFRKVDDA